MPGAAGALPLPVCKAVVTHAPSSLTAPPHARAQLALSLEPEDGGVASLPAKLSWLTHAVFALRPADPSVAAHYPSVMEQLQGAVAALQATGIPAEARDRLSLLSSAVESKLADVACA